MLKLFYFCLVLVLISVFGSVQTVDNGGCTEIQESGNAELLAVPNVSVIDIISLLDEVTSNFESQVDGLGCNKRVLPTLYDEVRLQIIAVRRANELYDQSVFCLINKQWLAILFDILNKQTDELYNNNDYCARRTTLLKHHVNIIYNMSTNQEKVSIYDVMMLYTDIMSHFLRNIVDYVGISNKDQVLIWVKDEMSKITNMFDKENMSIDDIFATIDIEDDDDGLSIDQSIDNLMIRLNSLKSLTQDDNQNDEVSNDDNISYMMTLCQRFKQNTKTLISLLLNNQINY